MGFDLHGLKPQINKNHSDEYRMIMDSYGNGDGWLDWNKRIPTDAKDKYFKLTDKYNQDNPGVYFRNNVWWWRPLWDLVCHYCDNVLTAKDMDRGHYNDGHKISKTKSIKIANKLTKILENGTVDTYMVNYETARRQAKADGEDFATSYPIDKGNISNFRDFCRESNGFTIC
tara:strand:- start:882 stop:1397 length:516 start_codon:yes stop_codon:yes gene_type:complete